MRNAAASDMIRSLAVILIPLLVITFLFTRNLRDHPVSVVDYTPILAQARQQSPYPVLAPTNLPSGWRATRASWVRTGENALNDQPSPRNAWTLGFLDPSATYIGLYQGDAQVEDLVTTATAKGHQDGSSTVDGQAWQRWISQDGRTRSLVLAGPKDTAIVAGDLPYEALEAYAGTLRSS